MPFNILMYHTTINIIYTKIQIKEEINLSNCLINISNFIKIHEQIYFWRNKSLQI